MKVKTPAKVNLGIDTLYRRNDGYHELEMVMIPIDLYDEIEIVELNENKIEIECNWDFIPTDERNIVYKAAKLVKEQFNIEKGVNIIIYKNIPAEAGLAGGSSDGAAVINLLNKMWNLKLSVEKRQELAAQLGMDVPFFIEPKPSFLYGRGEFVETIETTLNFDLILFKPEFNISTSEIYNHLDCEQVNHPNIKKIVSSLEKNDYLEMCQSLGNTLEEVSTKLFDEIDDYVKLFVDLGCDVGLMSGSGSTVFGITRNEAVKTRVNKEFSNLDGKLCNCKPII